jgi:hypothetical protein
MSCDVESHIAICMKGLPARKLYHLQGHLAAQTRQHHIGVHRWLGVKSKNPPASSAHPSPKQLRPPSTFSLRNRGFRRSRFSGRARSRLRLAVCECARLRGRWCRVTSQVREPLSHTRTYPCRHDAICPLSSLHSAGNRASKRKRRSICDNRDGSDSLTSATALKAALSLSFALLPSSPQRL